MVAQPDQGAPNLDLLERQLERMRGMLLAYSRLFFIHMRTYTLASLAILVSSFWEPFVAAALILPFLVPFVFMEASYLFWYTVFARRHAEWLERTLARRPGFAAPAAHRLEAAFFYEPDAPKIAALSLERPLSHMSAMTVAYTAGAGLLWVVGLLRGVDWVTAQGPDGRWLWIILGAAVLWTLAVAGYLLWTWLRRADEERLLAALDAAYPDGARSSSRRGEAQAGSSGARTARDASGDGAQAGSSSET